MPAQLKRGKDGHLYRYVGARIRLQLWEDCDDEAYAARQDMTDLMVEALTREVARRKRARAAKEARAASKALPPDPPKD